MLTITEMNMRELRERAGLSAEEAAFRLGVAHSTIRNWESGKTEPSLGVTKISELLKLYQCTFQDLEQAVKESASRGDK
uniref:helix-turn-helix domain-containing protein n=1 Tax=Trichocoleus desertorum TaxID=1481672 RepID=UPI0025B5A25B|nr:helix-turn-helix transcriptional regulator [Trichocoleus desertorum]